MKRKIFIIGIVLVGLFTLTACGQSDVSKISDALKFKEEYESLNGTKREKDGKTIRSIEISKDNPFIYKKSSEIIDMIEKKDTFVVYFGFSDCPWCRSIIPTLVEVAADLEVNQIYYVDVKNIRDTMKIGDDGKAITDTEGTKEYYQLLEKLDSVLENYTLTDEDGNEVNTGEKRIYAPNIVSIVDGVATEMTTGISDKQTDGYMELTTEIKEESYDKIKCSIQCVADSKQVCSAKTKC